MEIFLARFQAKSSDNIEIKKQQSVFSREIAKIVLDKFFNHNCEIHKKDSGAPCLDDGFKMVSIAHSDEFVAIAFDDKRIGIDIEKIKNRNYKKLLQRYNLSPNMQQQDFIKWWTIYEAEYKSQIKAKTYTFKIEDYICSISSENMAEPNIYILDEKFNIKTLIPKVL